MRSVKDSRGEIWRVEELARGGISASHLSDPYPAASIATLKFSKREGPSVIVDVPAGALEEWTDEALLERLDEGLRTMQNDFFSEIEPFDYKGHA